MKTALRLLIAALVLPSAVALSDDNECEKQFGEDVAYCAHSLSFLSPNVRAGAQKACVQEAKLAKEACMSGVNVCLTGCQTTYDDSVTFCQTAFDPTVCGTDTTCQQIILTNQAACITNAVTTLDACTASCPQ